MVLALDMVAGIGTGFDPLGDFVEGRKARNYLSELKRTDQARSLSGAALQGNGNALRGLAGVDANAFMEVSKFQQKDPASEAEKIARLVEWGDTPEKWTQVTQRIQSMGHKLEPQELDFNGRGAMLAEYTSLKDQAKQPQGFTLGEGQTRFDAQGNEIAAGLPKTSEPFTLGEGQKRFDAEGNEIAAGAPKPAGAAGATAHDIVTLNAEAITSGTGP